MSHDGEWAGRTAERGAPAAGPRRALPALAALLIYVVAGATLLHGALFGGRVLSACGDFVRGGPFPESVRRAAVENPHSLSDSTQCFVPWLRYAADAFARDGRLPLWKDTAGTGAPLLGNGQSAMFFPTNLLPILLGAPAGLLAVQALAKLVAGAFGAWLLARHLRLSFLASLLCGLVFGFGGFQMAWYLHPLSSVSLLLPLLVLATDRLALRPSVPRAAALALVAALQHLGGHPETAMHCQLAAALLGTARVLSLRPGRAQLARRLAWLGAAFVLGALLAAVQLLPTIEAMLQSATLAHRQDMAAAGISHALPAAAFGLCCLVALLALRSLARSPHLLASALVLVAATAAGLLAGLAAGMNFTFMTVFSADWFGSTRSFGGTGTFLEHTGAFAGAALPLAALGLLAGRPRDAARAGGIVLGIGLLAGFHAPIVSDLLEALPVLGVALNTRLQLLALLAIAVLAGLGLDALREPRSARDRGRLALLVLAPLLACIVALAIGARLDLVSAGDTPSRPEGALLVEARPLASSLVEPLLDAPPPGAPQPGEGPVRAICGYAKLPEPPAEIRVLHGGAHASTSAQWRDAPLAGGAPEASGAPRIYVFRALLPERELRPGTNLVRVWASLPGRGSAVSGLIAGPELPERWLPGSALPAIDGSAPQDLLLTLLVLAGAMLAPRGASMTAALRLALPAVVAASLLPFATSLVTLVPPEGFYPRSPVIDVLSSAAPDGRTLSLVHHLFAPEVPTFYGVHDLRSYDGIGSERLERVVDAALDRQRRAAGEPVRETAGSPDFSLLGVLGVRWLVSVGPSRTDFARVPLPPGAPDAAELDRAFPIEENPHWLPRARLASGAVVEPDDVRALALLRDPAFHPERDVVLAQGETRAARVAAPGSARITISRPDRVVVEVEPAAPGWLVLADTFYPGWSARVDGQPREIVRADVVLRAVAIAPGEHVVEFRYEPLSVRAGVAISLATALLIAGAVLVSCRRR